MSFSSSTKAYHTHSPQIVTTLPAKQQKDCHESARLPLTNTAKTPNGQHGLKFCAGHGGGNGAGSRCEGTEVGEVEGRESQIRRRVTMKAASHGGLADTESIVCAWWTGEGTPHARPDGQPIIAHMYRTTLKPTRPLVQGERIRLLALPTTSAPTLESNIGDYAPYEPHVHGVVIGVVADGHGWARAMVINECRGNAVGIVDLDLPEVPGVTVGGRTTGRAPREATWIGETPAGCQEWRGFEGKDYCGGSSCELQPAGSTGERNFRAIPKCRKGQEVKLKVDAPDEEGTSALHLWLKYEGYN
ncbi:hypothetical protein C8T65DRAFT_693537 [Cerioporus squamosus]|nr:hypothetical protein C8T65DRAFT_693537 [Cerioporus squamosus]